MIPTRLATLLGGTLAVAATAPAWAGPDRSGPPEVAPAAPLELPEPTTEALGDAVTVHWLPGRGVYRAEVRVRVWGGSQAVDAWPSPRTTAAGWLMDGAAKRWSPEAVSTFESVHDLDVSSSMSHHWLAVDLDVTPAELDEGLDLLEALLRAPTFPGKELKRYQREQRLYAEVEAPASSRSVAGHALLYAWYPEAHPYGARKDLDGLDATRRRDVREAHAAALTAGPVDVVVVGEVDRDRLRARLTEILDGVGRPGERPLPLETPPLAAPVVIGVDMPGLEQTVLALRHAAPSWAADDSVAFEAVNFALGGAFLSRLNTNLREEKGYTYGIYSRYGPGAHDGTWSTRVEVAVDNTGAAIDEIRRELATMAGAGCTPEEIDAAYRDAVSGWNDTYEGAASVAGAYTGRLEAHRTVADELGRLRALAQVTPEQTQAAAARWFGDDALHVWVIVGDRSALEDDLAARGLRPQWIAPDAAILGAFTPGAGTGAARR